jgi:quercetin dioxygenase-like cupin family protein
MEIKPKQPTDNGPSTRFTGDVWMDPIANGDEPSRIRVNAIRFSPGAHTAWHSHALGQTLYVTEGAGLAQSRGGDTLHIRAGDIVDTPAGEWHWHGATPNDYMTHLSITEGTGDSDKPESDWGEHVSDAEYQGHDRSSNA